MRLKWHAVGMRLTWSAALVALAIVTTAAANPPKLAVLIVVDQMRADYVDRFQGEWSSGLKRLVTKGAWFANAAYPYLGTATCAGHATVATGAFPATHGVVQNEWWDRQLNKLVTCTETQAATNLGYVGTATSGDSAYALRVPTLAEELRTQRGARVAAVSLKDRAAIMLSGKGAGAVTWRSGNSWVTSSAFTSAQVPGVERFIKSHAVEADFGKTWTRLLAPGKYRLPDTAIGERPPAGWTGTFPHVLNGTTGKPDAAFETQWEQSPFSDAFLGQFAAAVAADMELGKGDRTDVLAISFSALDYSGHSFGPDSQEVQDVLARLDRTIGTLLDSLDARVGAGNYVVALTGDHGVTPLPEQLLKAGKDGGRIQPKTIVDAVEERLRAAFGSGTYVATLDGRDVNLYLQPGVFDRLAGSRSVLDGVVRTIEGIEGIRHVFTRSELQGGRMSSDPLLSAAAISFDKERSGDLVLVMKPGWSAYDTRAAIHWNTATLDDQRVPLLLMGPGINPGIYRERVTPADIAPTLAALCGITLPRAEGHALRSAMTTPPTR